MTEAEMIDKMWSLEDCYEMLCVAYEEECEQHNKTRQLLQFSREGVAHWTAQAEEWQRLAEEADRTLRAEREQTAKRWDYPSAVESTTAEAIANWLDAHSEGVQVDSLANMARQIRDGKWRTTPDD